jgi:hypothetical protein
MDIERVLPDAQLVGAGDSAPISRTAAEPAVRAVFCPGHEAGNPHRANADSACIRDAQRRRQTWIIHP